MQRPRICANLALLFEGRTLEDRIVAAASSGFDGVECWFPYEIPAASVRAVLRSVGIPMLMINTPPGVAAAGGRGLAALPGYTANFRADLDRALGYAVDVGANFVHVMSGVPAPGTSLAVCQATLEENLRWACEQAAASGLTLLVEAINPVTTPGYFLNSLAQAIMLVRKINQPGLGLLYDTFHAGMLGEALEPGDVALVRHVQMAAVPDRSEPRDAPAIVSALRQSGYEGWFSGEYAPANATEDGLGWLEEVRTR